MAKLSQIKLGSTTYDIGAAWGNISSKPTYYDAKAIKGITRSGTTFTYTCMDGTTGTFTQKDDNTTYTFTNGNPTLSWGTKSTIGTAGGVDFTATMPSNPTVQKFDRETSNYKDGIVFYKSDGATRQSYIGFWNTAGIILNPSYQSKESTSDPWTTSEGLCVGATSLTFNGSSVLTASSSNYIKSLSVSGRTITYTKGDGSTGTLTTQDNNTTYSAGTGLTLSSTTFSVSKANASAILNLLGEATANMTSAAYVITSDASDPSDGLFYKRPVDKVVNATLVKAALGTGTGTTKYLREDGTWVKPPNTTYSNMTGATADAAGTAGLVPAPAKGKQTSFLRGDGTWVVPTNTTYSNMTGATADAAGKAGLVPAPAKGKQTSFLRGDGTWVVPTNTTYSAGTGLTLSSTTFSITSANASTIINLLSEGTSPATLDDYLVAQYAGGGTTTTTYHRRKVSNVVNATVVKAALGTGSGTEKYLREDGTWVKPPNTNTKVTQTVTTSNANYPLLLAPSGQTATTTTTSYFDSGVTLNPSTNTIAANISGNAATATALSTSAGSATKAIYFSSGKPADCNTNIAHNAKGIYGGTKLTSSTIDGFLEANVVKWAPADATAVAENDGIIMSFGWSDTYGAQLWLDDGSGEGGMKLRNRTSSSWNPWRQVLTSYNYEDYCLKNNPPFIELFPGSSAGHGGYIDFHYNSSSDDYTSRIIESSSGTLSLNGTTITSSLVKVPRLKITSTSGVNHIEFSRTSSYNYLSVPSDDSGAKIAFSINSSLASKNCQMVINRDSITPGTDGAISLGTSGTRWSNIFLSGQMRRVGISSSWYNGRDNAILRQTSYTGYNPIFSAKTTSGSWEMGPYTDNILYFVYNTDTGYNSGTNTSGQYFNSVNLRPDGTLRGAAWNDYAEFRICKDQFIPGQVICENNDDTLSISTVRLQAGAAIVSDTFGFAIGETENATCPIAVSGRVLAYPYEPREEYQAGDAVCAAPGGTVSRMTREEIREYPDRIIGVVSAVPDYEEWGTGKVKVNGRIWIKVK